MTNALSLYLDALRFGAALAFFLSHYSTGRISGGLFWQFDGGRTAVLVFFVLSGFVIAWVSETRERTLEEYGLSRVARLYSVIIPAFVLTAALDRIGKAIDPRLYGPEWGHSTAHPVIDYVTLGGVSRRELDDTSSARASTSLIGRSITRLGIMSYSQPPYFFGDDHG